MTTKSKITLVIAILIAAGAAVYWFVFRRPPAPQLEAAVLLDRAEVLEIREDYRPGMQLRSGQSWTKEIKVPAEGHLWFSFGLPHSETDNGPFRFRVTAKSRFEQILYSKVLHPSQKKQDRIWNDVDIDLSEFAGRTLRVVFQFDAASKKSVAYLSQGKIAGLSRESSRWNVLLISIDTLRRDHLSAYGYSRQTSPEIDRFARESSLFLNACSAAPLTVPSVTSILTSTYYSQHQVRDNRSSYDGRFPTLAEVLRKSGYSTAAFVGNAVLRPNRKLNPGFDVYNAFLPSAEVNRRLPERNAGQLNTAALTWLKSHSNERFFLWLHYQDPHAPYVPPPDVATLFDPPPSGKNLPVVADETGAGGIPEYARIPGVFDPGVYTARYDAEIHYVDSKIGEVLKAVRDLGIAGRTLIVLTADHGESLGEGDHYFAHGHNVTPELTDVPLIVSVPGSKPARYSQVVSTVDIAPTIVKFAGTQAPKTFQGRPLFDPAPDRTIVSEQPSVRWALIRKEGRIIYDRTGSFNPPANGSWKQDGGILQKWIADHVAEGCALAFSGEKITGMRIASKDRLKRAYLFDGEEGDRIEVDRDSVVVRVDAPAGDVDYVFIEPNADAELQIDGAPPLRDLLKHTVPSHFLCSSVAAGSGLPAAADFHGAEVLVVRKPGKAASIQLTPEEEEELKSIGYVTN